MAATLLVGGEDRESAKRRRKEEYRQDLELQMREKDAAKQRERLQGMSVNASGWLDPEKRPERFKPLGGVHWTETRGKRNDRVKPYHTLFLYGRDPAGFPLEPARTYAGAGAAPNHSVDQAYNFFATRDLGYGQGGGGGGGGSIVQPISIPYVDNRPIIVSGQNSGPGYQGPRFNPFDYRGNGDHSRELKHLLEVTQAEKDRLRRDNDDFQRRLMRELEDERRKLNDQESDARRRMDQLRREAEERRKEAERQRREAERLKREAETRPKSNPIRPSSKTMLYYDMNDYRQRLIDERKKIEALLKAGTHPPKDVWDVKVMKQPRLRLPPTPKSADRANRDNVQEFHNLKYRDFNARNQFRSVYPDVPMTNRRLEQQQEALLRHQESCMRDQIFERRSPRYRSVQLPPRRAMSRPGWLDRNPTPFPHVLRKRDMMYAAQSWDGDLDRIHQRNQERDKDLGNVSSRHEEEVLEKLKLRRHRRLSTETLTDDTWLRPSSTAEV